MDVGYYAPAARTTLNIVVFIMFLSEIELRLANPRVHTLWARAGAFRHPAVVCSTTTILEHKTVSACMLLPAVEWIIWYSISSKSPFGRAEGSLCEAGAGASFCGSSMHGKKTALAPLSR